MRTSLIGTRILTSVSSWSHTLSKSFLAHALERASRRSLASETVSLAAEPGVLLQHVLRIERGDGEIDDFRLGSLIVGSLPAPLPSADNALLGLSSLTDCRHDGVFNLVSVVRWTLVRFLVAKGTALGPEDVSASPVRLLRATVASQRSVWRRIATVLHAAHGVSRALNTEPDIERWTHDR